MWIPTTQFGRARPARRCVCDECARYDGSGHVTAGRNGSNSDGGIHLDANSDDCGCDDRTDSNGETEHDWSDGGATAAGSKRGTKQTALEQFCAQREGTRLRMLREAQLIDLSSSEDEGEKQDDERQRRGATTQVAEQAHRPPGGTRPSSDYALERVQGEAQQQSCGSARRARRRRWSKTSEVSTALRVSGIDEMTRGGAATPSPFGELWHGLCRGHDEAADDHDECALYREGREVGHDRGQVGAERGHDRTTRGTLGGTRTIQYIVNRLDQHDKDARERLQQQDKHIQYMGHEHENFHKTVLGRLDEFGRAQESLQEQLADQCRQR